MASPLMASFATSLSTTHSSKIYSLFNSSNQTTSIKLDRGNYLVWESIVLPLIEGNFLASHINNTGSTPPRFISEGTEMVPNPAFDEWHAVDRLLVGWLRNTMTQEIGAQLLHCRTTLDFWVGARTLTCASIKSRVMVLKSELHQTRKNSMKMDDYISKMKNIADQLILAEAPVATEDLILHTLNGLDSEYNAVVVKLIDQPNLTLVKKHL